MIVLNLEGELIADAAAELSRIHAALTHRHGDPFRALEQRIEALMEGPFKPKVTSLGSGHLAMAPPVEWTRIIVEARALGV